MPTIQAMSQEDMDSQWASYEAMLDERDQRAAESLGISLEELRRREAEHYAEMEREEEARVAAGGREICPVCGERKLVSSRVCMLGYPSHPGAEFSQYRRCENCDHKL